MIKFKTNIFFTKSPRIKIRNQKIKIEVEISVTKRTALKF